MKDYKVGTILVAVESAKPNGFREGHWGETTVNEAADAMTRVVKVEDFKDKVDQALWRNKGTIINENYVISPSIGVGYGCWMNDDYMVEIDPKHESKDTYNQYIFCVRDKKKNGEASVIMGVKTNGDGFFKGTLSGATGTFSGKLSAATGSFSGSLTTDKILLNPDSNVNKGCIMLNDLTESDGNTYKEITLINDLESNTDNLAISFGFKNSDTSQYYATAGLAIVKKSGSIYNKLYSNTYLGGKIYFRNNVYLTDQLERCIYCSGKFNTEGAVSIGNKDPGSYMLYVNGSGYLNGDLYCNSPVKGSMVHMFVQNGQHKGALAVNGDNFGLFDTTYEHWLIHVNASGKVTTASSLSDQRLKSGIKESSVNDALHQILAINHREFTLDYNNEYKDIGYIAQELMEINPKMVIEPDDKKDYYHIDTFYLESIITKAMQEFYSEFENSLKRISQLEQENKQLKEMMKNKS